MSSLISFILFVNTAQGLLVIGGLFFSFDSVKFGEPSTRRFVTRRCEVSKQDVHWESIFANYACSCRNIVGGGGLFTLRESQGRTVI